MDVRPDEDQPLTRVRELKSMEAFGGRDSLKESVTGLRQDSPPNSFTIIASEVAVNRVLKPVYTASASAGV